MGERLLMLGLAWVDLAAAVVAVCTLGLYFPNWGMEYLAWFRIRQYTKAAKHPE